MQRGHPMGSDPRLFARNRNDYLGPVSNLQDLSDGVTTVAPPVIVRTPPTAATSMPTPRTDNPRWWPRGITIAASLAICIAAWAFVLTVYQSRTLPDYGVTQSCEKQPGGETGTRKTAIIKCIIRHRKSGLEWMLLRARWAALGLGLCLASLLVSRWLWRHSEPLGGEGLRAATRFHVRVALLVLLGGFAVIAMSYAAYVLWAGGSTASGTCRPGARSGT